MTELSQFNLIRMFLCSLPLGVLFGAVYDIFRIWRIAFPCPVQNTARVRAWLSCIRVFFQDILFFAIVTVSFTLFLFNINDGQFRLFLFLGVVFGFFLWYETVGKIVIRCADIVIRALRRALYFLYRLTVFPLLVLGRTLLSLCGCCVLRFICLISDLQTQRMLLHDARAGFRRMGKASRRTS